MLTFEILMGRVPFEASRTSRSTRAAARGRRRRPDARAARPEEAIAFIGGLLAEEEVRLGCGPTGFLPIREHPWFKSVDWTGLLRRDVAPPYEPGVVVRDVGGQVDPVVLAQGDFDAAYWASTFDQVGPFIASLDADGDAAEKVSEAELVRRIALGPPDSPGKSTRSPAGNTDI